MPIDNIFFSEERCRAQLHARINASITIQACCSIPETIKERGHVPSLPTLYLSWFPTHHTVSVKPRANWLVSFCTIQVYTTQAMVLDTRHPESRVGLKNPAGDEFSFPHLGTCIKKKKKLKVLFLYTKSQFLFRINTELHIMLAFFWELISFDVYFFGSKMVLMVKTKCEVHKTFFLFCLETSL